MQTVALKPKRAEWTMMMIGLLVLCIAMFVVPVACVPLALAAPLLACPLIGRKEEAAAWFSAAAPVMASLLAGYDALYAVSLLLIGALPLLITRLVPIKQRPGLLGMLMYGSALAFSLTIVIVMASRMLGGPLQYSLPKAIVEWVADSPNRQTLLRRFAMSGFVSIPDGYTARGAAGVLMEAAYSRQMLMSLRLTLEKLIAQELPSLFVQVCIIGGVFIPLRLERVNGVLLVIEARTPADQHTRVVAPPSFRLLTMPRFLRTTAFALAVASLVLSMSGTDFAYTMGKLCYGAFHAMFSLTGAAVLVFRWTRYDPDRKTLAGVLACFLYVMTPHILFFIGLMDQTFHFRNSQGS